MHDCAAGGAAQPIPPLLYSACHAPGGTLQVRHALHAIHTQVVCSFKGWVGWVLLRSARLGARKLSDSACVARIARASHKGKASGDVALVTVSTPPTSLPGGVGYDPPHDDQELSLTLACRQSSDHLGEIGLGGDEVDDLPLLAQVFEPALQLREQHKGILGVERGGIVA